MNGRADSSESTESVGEASQVIAQVEENGNASLLMDKSSFRKSADSDDTLLEELEGLLPVSGSAEGKTDEHYAQTDEPKKLKHRPKSIRIQLEKTAKNGQYQLNLEDPELRNLLLQGFETDKAGKIKQKPSQFGTTILKKQFTAFDRQHPDAELPSFHGFFSLFWMGVGLLLVRIAANNWRKSGSIFGENAILRLMFSQDVFLLGAIDCLMMSSAMLVSLVIQLLCLKNWIIWDRTGWLIQNIWQTIFLGAFIAFCRIRWPDMWTHSVFITLHTITILMKQHSYAFYNGYLSEIYKKRKALEQKLALLEDAEVQSPTSPGATLRNLIFRSSRALPTIPSSKIRQSQRTRRSRHNPHRLRPRLRRSSLRSRSQVPPQANPLGNRQLHHRTPRHLQNYPKPLPANLTLTDALSYIPLPTLLYELEYPRQPRISWWYVLEKTTATFGVLGVMIVVSEAFIYPIVMDILAMKAAHIPLSARLAEFPWAFSDLLFPFMLEYLLSWYVIWECVLNLLAELTCFEDRGFYNAWWNSTSWDQFARDWNAPVHAFLLRFAYKSSISSWRLSKGTATLVTFLISACVHELVMAVIFGKIRGYLLAMQMAQLPLVMLSRTRFLRGKDVLGNLVFWLGIFVGPSFLCSLYLFL